MVARRAEKFGEPSQKPPTDDVARCGLGMGAG